MCSSFLFLLFPTNRNNASFHCLRSLWFLSKSYLHLSNLGFLYIYVLSLITMWRGWILLCFTAFASPTGSSAPIPMPWSTTSFFGPDGPWQAVVVEIGTGSTSTVNLYPGGVFAHSIMSTRLCSNKSSCTARSAGLYDISASSTAFHNFTYNEASAGEWGSELAMNETSSAEIAIDQLSF